MGFFKNIHTLTQQAKEIQAEQPPMKERMAAATARMAAAQDFMAAQTHAAQAAASGMEVPVTITALRQVGMMNFEPMIEFELTATPDGRPPYPATARQTVSPTLLPQLQPGASLTGRADPNDPTAIWLDVLSVS